MPKLAGRLFCYYAPMKNDSIYQTYLTAQTNLQRLGFIRGVALLGQWLALGFFTVIKPIGLPMMAIAIILAIYTAITIATWLRSRTSVPIVDREFFAHLLIDIFFFSMLLYFSGGASNPFISYYLIPISIAAITLPGTLSIIVALVALGSYSLLLNQYVPLVAIAPMDMAAMEMTSMDDPHSGHSGSASLHIIGMWVNFAISALIIIYFIRPMANTVKRQQQEIADQREIQLRDEQLLAVGTLAAGTAHELGTPLNTMKIIVDELVADTTQPNPEHRLLQQQIETCKQTLKKLLMTAEESQSDQQKPILVQEYFSQLMERWQLMRPSLKASISLDKNQCMASFHPTIEQSIINLLNNAADASPEKVEVVVSWNTESATVDIHDHGPGLAGQDINNLGQAFVTDKADGLGLGLFLSQATLTRFGGSVRLHNAPGGGTHTQIILPLVRPSESEPTESGQ
ncbi:MAG: ATP-binding protein [Porticoccaceae bacterium]